MAFLIQDPKGWRGRAQLHGVNRGDRVDYVQGPKIGQWVWNSDANPILQTLESAVYTASLDASDRLSAKKAELVATGRYTPAGIKDELRAFAEKSVKPTLDRAKVELEAAQRTIRDRRSAIKPVPAPAAPDDAVTMLRKMEARQVLRTMSRRELVNVLAGANPDPIFVQAALESAPHMVASINPSLRAHLEQQAIEAQFGPQIEELDELDRAVSDAARAASVVAADVTRELQGIQAVPTAADKNEERRERAAFVDEHGHEAYLNRGSAA